MANFSQLPSRARERATALQNTADVARISANELTSQARELRWDRQTLAGYIRDITARRFDSASESEVAGERRRLADLDAEIARIDDVVQTQSAAYASARALTGRIDEFLRGLRPEHVIADRPVAPPALKRGEDLRDAIESRRRRVRELIAERAAVEAAPISSAEAKRLAREQVERLAERGRPNIGPLLAGDERFKFSTVLGLVKIPQVGAGDVAQTDVEGLICWLFGPQLTAAIDAEIDRLADDAIALTDQQRATRLEQLANELIATEREEVALVELAAEQGIVVAHRPDIDVRALLAIETQLVAEAA